MPYDDAFDGSVSPGTESPLTGATDVDGCGDSRTGRVGGVSVAGAPPSNTAPPKYTHPTHPGFRLLRWAVDSLYLSYPGVLSEAWESRLLGLKLLAHSEDDELAAAAQVKIGEHLFEVSDRGQGRFPFLLVDNCFRIQVSSRNSRSLPLAYVQISSEALTTLLLEEYVFKYKRRQVEQCSTHAFKHAPRRAGLRSDFR